ncbi:MAG: alpha/beta hydrolase [Actinomycetota bacterium]
MSVTADTQSEPGAIRPPSALLTAAEYRAVAERAHFATIQPLLRRLPRGDGHGVLVFPGFMASDRSTQPLRRLLRDLGYRTYGWGQGQNIGPTSDAVTGLTRRLLYVADRTGGEVSLIGWSLGGIYAREMARARPDLVRLVVTLGSPIQMADGDSSSAQRMWELMQRFHDPDFFGERLREVDRPKFPVPATSIYSATDGIVAWKASLIRKTPISENVRVFGSHCGLGHNAAAVSVIADRLAQPAGEWTPFSPPWWLRGAFPPARDLDRDLLLKIAPADSPVRRAS